MMQIEEASQSNILDIAFELSNQQIIIEPQQQPVIISHINKPMAKKRCQRPVNNSLSSILSSISRISNQKTSPSLSSSYRAQTLIQSSELSLMQQSMMKIHELIRSVYLSAPLTTSFSNMKGRHTQQFKVIHKKGKKIMNQKRRDFIFYNQGAWVKDSLTKLIKITKHQKLDQVLIAKVMSLQQQLEKVILKQMIQSKNKQVLDDISTQNIMQHSKQLAKSKQFIRIKNEVLKTLCAIATNCKQQLSIPVYHLNRSSVHNAQLSTLHQQMLTQSLDKNNLNKQSNLPSFLSKYLVTNNIMTNPSLSSVNQQNRNQVYLSSSFISASKAGQSLLKNVKQYQDYGSQIKCGKPSKDYQRFLDKSLQLNKRREFIQRLQQLPDTLPPIEQQQMALLSQQQLIKRLQDPQILEQNLKQHYKHYQKVVYSLILLNRGNSLTLIKDYVNSNRLLVKIQHKDFSWVATKVIMDLLKEVEGNLNRYTLSINQLRQLLNQDNLSQQILKYKLKQRRQLIEFNQANNQSQLNKVLASEQQIINSIDQDVCNHSQQILCFPKQLYTPLRKYQFIHIKSKQIRNFITPLLNYRQTFYSHQQQLLKKFIYHIYKLSINSKENGKNSQYPQIVQQENVQMWVTIARIKKGDVNYGYQEFYQEQQIYKQKIKEQIIAKAINKQHNLKQVKKESIIKRQFIQPQPQYQNNYTHYEDSQDDSIKQKQEYVPDEKKSIKKSKKWYKKQLKSKKSYKPLQVKVKKNIQQQEIQSQAQSQFILDQTQQQQLLSLDYAQPALSKPTISSVYSQLHQQATYNQFERNSHNPLSSIYTSRQKQSIMGDEDLEVQNLVLEELMGGDQFSQDDGDIQLQPRQQHQLQQQSRQQHQLQLQSRHYQQLQQQVIDLEYAHINNQHQSNYSQSNYQSNHQQDYNQDYQHYDVDIEEQDVNPQASQAKYYNEPILSKMIQRVNDQDIDLCNTSSAVAQNVQNEVQNQQNGQISLPHLILQLYIQSSSLSTVHSQLSTLPQPICSLTIQQISSIFYASLKQAINQFLNTMYTIQQDDTKIADKQEIKILIKSKEGLECRILILTWYLGTTHQLTHQQVFNQALIQVKAFLNKLRANLLLKKIRNNGYKNHN